MYEVYLETCPVDEDAVQISRDVDYMPEMKAQAIRFKRAILAAFPPPEGSGAYLKIQRCEHDFGSYLEVMAIVPDGDDADDAMKWAEFLESELPTTWAELEGAALVGGTV
jgi:hypothetical protein